MWQAYALAGVSVIFGSTGQVLFKTGMRHQHLSLNTLFTWPILLGLLAYGVSTLLWLRVLGQLPLTTAYPLLSLNFVLVALGGMILLGEPFSWRIVVGTAVIIGGLMVIVG